eukprot:snap_masked-scaffold_3-processed-gene-10.38-mRNA-1 protein AED:1.00 eAED:1.00 QI:0/-1/0/0/-1/1/1/0/102
MGFEGPGQDELLIEKHSLLIVKELREPKQVPEARQRQLVEKISKMKHEMERKIEDVRLKVRNARRTENQRYNERYKVITPQFGLGDWVLNSKKNTKREKKEG